MTKCSYCGSQNEDESLFCTECGKELPKGIGCPHCGASVNEGDVFCTECGKRIDVVPQATSSEPTKPKCPHCGALINEGDAFCMECGKKLDEPQPTEAVEVVAQNESVEETPSEIVDTPQTEEEDIETPQAEEETKDFDYSYVEEEPKTWRDYKLSIFGGIFIVLFLGACWWYYSSSSIRVAREKVIADSLETVRIDSMRKAEAKIEAERQAEEQKKREEEAEQFCKRFSLKDLLCLLRNYENPNKAESSGLSFIYKDVTKEEYGDDITIVYGKYIEKDGKNQLKSTTTHSCFFQVLLDTSTQYRINFSNKDDANSFFDKVLEYGVIRHENYYYIPRKQLPDGMTITVDSIDWSSDYAPIYCIEPPNVIEGYYSIIIGDIY